MPGLNEEKRRRRLAVNKATKFCLNDANNVNHFSRFSIGYLRVSVQKNQKLSGKFQNFKIAQTWAISGPY